MAKVPARTADYLAETLAALRHPGCLLAAQGEDGQPNAMTIGWGTVGIVWGREVFVVLVRPSRYTWELLQANGGFTVNVPAPSLAQAVAFCGSASGRDVDKFAETGLTAIPGKHVAAPLVEQCVAHYECRTIHANEVVPQALDSAVAAECYPSGDFHTLYYGQIVGVLAEEDARARLRA
ncbi:MAG: flavin reductase family protein [Candidatus Brocadiia bacterium]